MLLPSAVCLYVGTEKAKYHKCKPSLGEHKISVGSALFSNVLGVSLLVVQNASVQCFGLLKHEVVRYASGTTP